jgi:predicted dehydrogenase
MNVAIIGCGFIGHKRAGALAGCRLVACADVVWERATALARQYAGAQPVVEWREAVARQDVDIVLVCTTHEALAHIALAAISVGKHVMLEKPAARRAVELVSLSEAAQHAGVVVRVGFNHRYHPAMRQTKALCDAGALEELFYVRGRYGHGGRPGYYRMLPEMGPPETTIWEYPQADTSWAVEFAEFVEDIRCGRPPAAGLSDAQAVLQVIERIYEGSGL